MKPSRIWLLHWDANKGTAMANHLRESRFQVEYDPKFESSLLRQWRADPPDVFVIDLSRLPSQGREIAIEIRRSPKTRHVPIIFCDGAREKVALVRGILPDAIYTTGTNLLHALEQAKTSQASVQPAPAMNRYGNRTVAQKLGLKEGYTLALIDPPRGAETIIGEMPDGVELLEEAASVTLCFVQSVDNLRADMFRLRGLADRTKLWFVWRKKSAQRHDGITEQLVRETGIQLGLVDYKICAVDETWSAMLFARKK